MAQAIGYLISPFLTRIYTPEEMGELGVYMRIVGFVSALATTRFELSLPIPKYEGHSYLLYKLSLKIARVILTGLFGLLILFYFVKPLVPSDFVFGILTIISTGFVVFINLGTNWSIRQSDYKKISRQRIVNSLTSNSLKWIFGVFSMGAFGLILASLIGFGLSSVWFIKDFFSIRKNKYSNYSSKKYVVLAKEFKHFPLVSLPHVLVDLGRDLLIAFLIVYFYGKDVFGYYNHSYMILKLPMVIVGASIGQVFFKKCSVLVNNDRSTFPLMKRTIIILLGLSVVPFSLIFFFGEEMFGFVFSEAWAKAGYFSQIMTVWLMANFLISPLSSLPLILRRQGEFFVIGLIGSILQLACFTLIPIVLGGGENSFISLLWTISISQAIFLVFVIFISLYYSKKGVKE
ncbi:MAG: oligosaccharide flippase family protein [Crocinitomicaceae bacterium]|nr:oligosaccharide flippase family protein [Crocinitomicaceae bacterium]